MTIRRALLYAFDYIDSINLCLQSSINDIHLIWTLLTSKYLLEEKNILIVGQLDLNGKMLPWKSRYFSSLEINETFVDHFLHGSDQVFVYFTAHGNEDGSLLYGHSESRKKIEDVIPDRFLKSNQTWIVADMCYSHLFTSSHLIDEKLNEIGPNVFIPCSKEHPAALSTQCGSIFTIGFVKTLMSDETDFFEWLFEETYETSQKATLPFSDPVDTLCN